MTDKQQIEEIQLIMLNAISKRYFSTKDVKLNNDKEFIKQAEALYNAGYRKIPENAVVLTQQEYKALMLEQKRLKEIVDRIPCGYELKDKTRKQTAKEILQALRKKAYTNNYCQEIILASELDELAKQFGVEVE